MSSPMQQRKSRADLTDFRRLVEQGTDEISRRWLAAVRVDTEVPSTDGVSDPLLVDDVPVVLREILRVIEMEENEIEHARIFNAAHHGRLRARQNFVVKELVREYQLLRKYIFLYLQEHLGQLVERDAGEMLTIYRRVGLAIDEAMRETIDAFVEEHTGELRHLSRTDSLTGLYNHRTFYERLAEELKRAARYKSPLSIAVIDLDGFKAVNDIGGHQFGDHLLVKCSQVLSATLRETDIICRYGGDEFSIIFPETGREDAGGLMNRLQEAFKELGAKEGAPASFGLSFGLATYLEHEGAAIDLVRAADEQLLANKQRGRDAR